MDSEIPQIAKHTTLNLFKNFSNIAELDEDVENAIIECGDLFWKLVVDCWEANAMHAGHRHMEASDVQLHMLRIGLIQNYSEYSALIRRFLPLELVHDVLKVVQAKKHSKKPLKKQLRRSQNRSKNLSINLSSGQMYARRKSFSHTPKRTKH